MAELRRNMLLIVSLATTLPPSALVNFFVWSLELILFCARVLIDF